MHTLYVAVLSTSTPQLASRTTTTCLLRGAAFDMQMRRRPVSHHNQTVQAQRIWRISSISLPYYDVFLNHFVFCEKG